MLSLSDPVDPPSIASAMRSGVLTGVAQLALAASAAGAGALLAQKFGRTASTDGFLAAYQVYVVVTVAAQSFRIFVVPDLTRAATAGTLGVALRGYVVAVALLGIPAALLVAFFAMPIGDALTGTLPVVSAREASRAVVWLVPAAFVQLIAALIASALAALDNYAAAALGSAAGGLTGLTVFAMLASDHGLVSLAWGLTLDAAVATVVPLVWLVRKGGVEGGASPLALLGSLRRLVEGAAIPIAIQAFTLIALRVLANLGVGHDSSFSYASLLGATIVAATVYSLAVAALAPLTRRGLDLQQASAFVIHASWLTLALAGAATGVIALAGAPIFGLVLGDHYRSIGRIFLLLTPWLVAATAYYAVFPLLFVVQRQSRLVPIALAAVVLDVPLAVVLRNVWGMPGVALSLAVITSLVTVALMMELSPELIVLVASQLLRLVLFVGCIAFVCFGLGALLLPPLPAAFAGAAAYAILLLVLRGHGLGEAWDYVRLLR